MGEHHMRQVLITGGCGFIGSNLVHWLNEQHPQVQIVNLDLLTYAADPKNLEGLPHPEQHQLIKGDICDRSLVSDLFATHRFDTVIHLAAESHVDRSIDSSHDFMRTNILGTHNLIDLARAAWVDRDDCRFHHVSTDEVFGDLDDDDPAFLETTAYDPSSPYSASKAASDHLVRAWARTYGLPVTLSNCSNNYGPRQHNEKLIPVVIRACLQSRPIPVYGQGINIRDWLHVRDHCRALIEVVQHGENGQTYNVGGDNERRNIDLVRLICRLVAEHTGTTEQSKLDLITFVTDRPGHDRRYAVDSSKLQSTLDWKPKEAFEDGLRETVRWVAAR